MAFPWWADDGQTLHEWWLGSFAIFRGSGPVLLENPIFVNFQEGPDPLPPSRFAQKMLQVNSIKLRQNVVYKNIQYDKGWKLFIYLLNHNQAEPGYLCFENSADPDQLASEKKPSDHGSTLFSILSVNCMFKKLKSCNLIGKLMARSVVH